MEIDRDSITSFAHGHYGSPPWTPPETPPPTSHRSSADVVIVGAGITGLSAAIAAARQGMRVAVLEHQFGSGATVRSGGIVLGETLAGPARAFDGCDLALREWIDVEQIDCDLHWHGCLELSRDAPLASTAAIDWNDGGRVRACGRVSGGVLDPAKLLAGLAGVARQAGVLISNGARVLGAEPRAGGVRLSTDLGPVTTIRAVMAVDAMSWSRTFDPWEKRAVTVALRTAPLEGDALGDIGLESHDAFYTNDLPLLWGRVMPDQSLIVGREMLPFPPRDRGDATALGDDLDIAGARLTTRVRGLHRALSAVGIRNVWAGPIAKTAVGYPAIVADPEVSGLLWAGGYGGHGIAQAFRVGQLVAEAILTTS